MGLGDTGRSPASARPVGAPTLQTTMPTGSDPMFARPYIDVDEVRSSATPYRYVHGGFSGTDTRFSYYFPAASAYRDRFFQYITPVPDSETLSQGLRGAEDRIGMALSSGAYFVETNGGGPKAADPRGGIDPLVGAYKANAAAAQFSKEVARQIYNRKRVFGYLYGGSGGAYRTIGAIENTTGVWDGAVPYVIGSPMAIPNMFTVRLHAMRVVGDKLDDVVAALEPGGSGNPYATLNLAQRDALREATRMGFQPRSWYAWRTMGPHAFSVLFGVVRSVDPGYFTEFWTRPGYAGYDHPEQYSRDRVRLSTTIKGIVTFTQAASLGLVPADRPGTAAGTADQAWRAMGLRSSGEMPFAYRLSTVPRSKALLLSDLVLPSGKKVLLDNITGDLAVISGDNDPAVLTTVKSGSEVRLDNSDILAVQTYHRHQVPTGSGYPVWDQFRGADGKPSYPQRPMLLGPLISKAASGALPTGRFDGKMIILESLWDREALPWQADWYRSRIEENKTGGERNNYRLWFTDRALHGDTLEQDDGSRAVPYLGVLQQALRDLAAWVQDGVEPPASSSYAIQDGQVIVPTAASDRRGIQPQVSLTVDGRDAVAIKAGGTVRLTGEIVVPPGAGSVVAAEWDFEGDGRYEGHAVVPAAASARRSIATEHRYTRKGTYFAVLRGTSQRENDRTSPFARVQNLARVRITVS